PIGNKFFPRLLTSKEEAVEVRITALTAGEKLAPDLFLPLAESTSRPGCMNPVPPRLVHRVWPRYPEQERQSRTQGTVVTSATIDKEGVPRGLRIVSSVSSSLDQATMDALQSWRYEPATCANQPVAIDIVVTTIFTLDH